jgi:hypothetical protein
MNRRQFEVPFKKISFRLILPTLLINLFYQRMINVPCMGEKRNAYRILVGRPGHRWEDNIKMDLRERERGWGGVD